MPDRFAAGDKVERVQGGRRCWRQGVVVMVVPAGVSPYAMFRRWFRDKGTCKMPTAREPVFHKERVIVRAEHDGKTCFYCPCLNMIRKV